MLEPVECRPPAPGIPMGEPGSHETEHGVRFPSPHAIELAHEGRPGLLPGQGGDPAHLAHEGAGVFPEENRAGMEDHGAQTHSAVRLVGFEELSGRPAPTATAPRDGMPHPIEFTGIVRPGKMEKRAPGFGSRPGRQGFVNDRAYFRETGTRVGTHTLPPARACRTREDGRIIGPPPCLPPEKKEAAIRPRHATRVVQNVPPRNPRERQIA